jgi:hypothetical protein
MILRQSGKATVVRFSQLRKVPASTSLGSCGSVTDVRPIQSTEITLTSGPNSNTDTVNGKLTEMYMTFGRDIDSSVTEFINASEPTSETESGT